VTLNLVGSTRAAAAAPELGGACGGRAVLVVRLRVLHEATPVTRAGVSPTVPDEAAAVIREENRGFLAGRHKEHPARRRGACM
jgi:hypothetical protein